MPERAILSLPIHRFDSVHIRSDQDLVAVEEPLLIRLNGEDVAVTMRTPGNDAELAAGFLYSEGIIGAKPEITGTENGLINLTAIDRKLQPERRFYINSSCGVCGRASIDNLLERGCLRIDGNVSIDIHAVSALPERLRSSQQVFEHTGGLHAAGLFDGSTGGLIEIREDVGRHNAVDKLIGSALLHSRLPLDRHVLMLSGRVSFELIQKAVMAGIPIVAAVGAPSSLAVQTALRFGITLIGFVRDGHCNLYTCAERIRV